MATIVEDEERVQFTPAPESSADERLDRLAALVERSAKTSQVALIIAAVFGCAYAVDMLLGLSRIIQEVWR
jgi:hypothetical protein